MCIPCIAGQTGPSGHKAFPGLHKKRKFPKNWIGTFGWAPHPTRITLRSLFHSIGGDGGTMERVRWAIWPVTLSNLPLKFWDWVIPKQLNAVWEVSILMNSSAGIFRKAVPLRLILL